MAHPFSKFKATKVGKQRAMRMVKGPNSSGGAEDKNSFAGLGAKLPEPEPVKTGGKLTKGRMDKKGYASGGRTKKTPSVTVNVISAPKEDAGGPKGLMLPPPPMGGPPAGAMPPPPGAGPGAGPPAPPIINNMPPAGPPPRAYGGRAYKKGGKVKDGGAVTKPGEFKRGGMAKAPKMKSLQKDTTNLARVPAGPIQNPMALRGMPKGPKAYKTGGYISGVSTEGNIKKWGKYASKNYRRGGLIGGAESGVGRLERAKAYKG